VEASRKHGSFDTRWPCVRRDGAGVVPDVSLGAAELAEELDWDAFCARHFADRGRHDSEARSAYAAYRQGHEWRPTGSPALTRLSLVRAEPASAEAEADREESSAQRLLAAVAAVDREPKGG
jgi:hypothetical protein